jgi:hypothetical protein
MVVNVKQTNKLALSRGREVVQVWNFYVFLSLYVLLGQISFIFCSPPQDTNDDVPPNTIFQRLAKEKAESRPKHAPLLLVTYLLVICLYKFMFSACARKKVIKSLKMDKTRSHLPWKLDAFVKQCIAYLQPTSC